MNKKIFPNDEAVNVSTEFDIEEAGVLITARGMVEGQSFLVEFYHGDECEGYWVPVNFCCGQLRFQSPLNQFIMPPVPGKYRLVAVQFVNTDVEEAGFLPFNQDEWEEVELRLQKMKVEIPLNDFIQACC